VERISAVDYAEDLTAIAPGMVAVEVTCFDTSKGIYASGVYRADLFTPETMERFMVELRSTAQQFVRDPLSAVITPSLERIPVGLASA
jgi:hypothetical protein